MIKLPSCASIDYNIFKVSKIVKSVLIPKSKISSLIKKLKIVFPSYSIDIPKVSHLIDLKVDHDKADTHKRLLISDEVISNQNINKIFDNEILTSVSDYTLNLTYDNFSFGDALKQLLPPDVAQANTSGYSQIGHIVHMNLRDEVVPYKEILGQVMIDKIPNCKTVVNKIGTIENEYRNFSLEVLAGEPVFETEHRSLGCVFHLDFSKVYYNPRLTTEHERVGKRLHRDDLVYDLCAGIGPFAVPAGRRARRVLANDLNPESFKWLSVNIKRNKVTRNVAAYNMDARDFSRSAVAADLVSIAQQILTDKVSDAAELAADAEPDSKRAKTDDNESRLFPKHRSNCYFLMNLPALAIQFLDVFPALIHDFLMESRVVAQSENESNELDQQSKYSNLTNAERKEILDSLIEIFALDESDLPRLVVLCYTFWRDPATKKKCDDNDVEDEVVDDITMDVKLRAEKFMGCAVPDDSKVRFVRNVAPFKDMMCLEMVLPWSLLLTSKSNV